MKKFIFFLSLIFALNSCETTAKNKEESLPIEVTKLMSANQFDTLTVVETDKKMYIFEKSEYKYTLQTKDNTLSVLLLGVILGIILVGFLAWMFD